MREMVLVSCYTSLLLFLTYFTLWLMRRETVEFLRGAAFFLSGTVYLLACYGMEASWRDPKSTMRSR